MSSKTSKKIQPPAIELTHVTCRVCGFDRKINEYRVFRATPLMNMDFCVYCEKKEGTLALYRRYSAYATPEIVDAVFAAGKAAIARRTPEQTRLLVDPANAHEVEDNTKLIERELKKRELARRSLLFFATQFKKDYLAGWCHQDIARRLEKFVRDCEQGLSPRLIIAMPPRHGKSELASVQFAAWILGLHPEWNIIGASYAITLPTEFSRTIRDNVRSPEYKAIFPNTELRKDTTGVEEWKTTKGGGYIAAGVGTGINGKGMHVGILDDAIKDAEAGSSETIRNSTYAWYKSVFRTRLAPGAGILVIGTRWHYDDPIGREIELDEQLAKAGVPPEERENWDIVSYPAIAENDEFLMHDGTIADGVYDEQRADIKRLLRRKGEALHPERWNRRELIKLRNGMPPAEWSALYQQKPTPDDGVFFKRGDFRYRQVPKDEWMQYPRFMTVDYAIGKGQGRNFTVIGVHALGYDGRHYLLSVRRGRFGSKEIVDNVMALVREYEPHVYAGERGAIHAAVWPLIEDALVKARIGMAVDDTLTPIQDKEVRARPLQASTQRHNFVFSYDTSTKPEIYDIIEREMLQFPSGRNDDCVDMLAWGARLALNTAIPKEPQPPKTKSWKDKLLVTQGSTNTSHMAA